VLSSPQPLESRLSRLERCKKASGTREVEAQEADRSCPNQFPLRPRRARLKEKSIVCRSLTGCYQLRVFGKRKWCPSFQRRNVGFVSSWHGSRAGPSDRGAVQGLIAAIQPGWSLQRRAHPPAQGQAQGARHKARRDLRPESGGVRRSQWGSERARSGQEGSEGGSRSWDKSEGVGKGEGEKTWGGPSRTSTTRLVSSGGGLLG
jgi:hypothetical protein